MPRRTVRLRLSLLYGTLFLAAGAGLLAITYALVVNHGGPSKVTFARGTGGATVLAVPPKAILQAQSAPVPSVRKRQATGKGPAIVVQQRPGTTAVAYLGQVNAEFKRLTTAQKAQARDFQRQANVRIAQVRSDQLSTLLTRSGVALAIMALASIGLGWLMAGRALRPVRTMSIRARGISERNLHERLALDGPDDELKELGDTFDGLLSRLEAAFESQRRFVANASHELRTPITLERALVELALSDPNASVESLKDTCRRVLAATHEQERLIEALLTLARSQRGLESRTPVDLGAITTEVVRAAPANGLRVRTELADAPTTGDPAMVERLVANLVENAVRYNRPNGELTAWTGVRDGRATLEIANDGPIVEGREVGEFVKPFYRGGEDGNGNGNGHGLGLGLSIVQAIADAHGAELTTSARREGGLKVAVAFPAADLRARPAGRAPPCPERTR